MLEHVDDIKAAAELFRILTPGGRMMILVPAAEGWSGTYENPQAFELAALKALHYGKDNQPRRFGRDVRERLATAGFVVEDYHRDGESTVHHGLLPGENLFICRKPPA